ncbi:MAG: MOSC domain-containing protein [Chlorobiaceae bacterium]|nr:MOSC domain-containing protein [Chlorobiaceae bacterium]NTV61581.1 MOSC domain-containing protein [Chlorobiaceae bacterium]
MGIIEAVCISMEKGTIKKAMDEITLHQEWGIEGDAHAGAWHRQVSLLAGESIDRMREIMPGLDNGMFAENIVTRGIDLSRVSIGDRLSIGGCSELEVTQIGKDCHNSGCAIQAATGECIMPKEGVFCRVIRGGSVRPGMSIELPLQGSTTDF